MTTQQTSNVGDAVSLTPRTVARTVTVGAYGPVAVLETDGSPVCFVSFHRRGWPSDDPEYRAHGLDFKQWTGDPQPLRAAAAAACDVAVKQLTEAAAEFAKALAGNRQPARARAQLERCIALAQTLAAEGVAILAGADAPQLAGLRDDAQERDDDPPF